MKSTVRTGFVGLAGAVLVLAGCRSQNSVAGLNQRFDRFMACLNASGEEPEGPVVALVGNSPITLADVQSQLALMPENIRSQFSTPEGRRALVNSMIERRLIAMTAGKMGLQRDSAYRYRITMMNESLLKEELVNHLSPITDAQIMAYYHLHQAQYGPRVVNAAAKKTQALLNQGKSPKGATGLPLDAVRLQIRNQLEGEVIAPWVEKARSSIPVTIDEKVLASLSIPTNKAP